MIKIILFDIDGLFIRLPHFYSTELEKNGYKNAEESLNSFYTGIDNHNCLEGKADIKDVIVPYLKKFDWQETATDYLDKAFHYEKKYLDKNLLALLKQLRKENIKCCLCTDQEKYRAKFLLNDLDFQNTFDKHYFSCFIGYRKCHDQFWAYVLDDLKSSFPGIKNNEVVFFDDLQNSIDTAIKSGIQAFLFSDSTQFKKILVKLRQQHASKKTK